MVSPFPSSVPAMISKPDLNHEIFTLKMLMLQKKVRPPAFPRQSKQRLRKKP